MTISASDRLILAQAARIRAEEKASHTDAHGIQDGAVFDRRFPFIFTTYDYWDEDGTVTAPTYVPGWAVEVDAKYLGYGEYSDRTIYKAHGWGVERRTVISLHKPGKYPKRVFYARTWVSPDGREFGNVRLRIATKGQFNSWLKGRLGDVFDHINIAPKTEVLELRRR